METFIKGLAIFVVAMGLVIALSFVEALIAMWIWNGLVAPDLHLPQPGFWAWYGICLLFGMLVKNTASTGKS